MSACQTYNKLQKKRNRHRMCHISIVSHNSPIHRELVSLLYLSPYTLFDLEFLKCTVLHQCDGYDQPSERNMKKKKKKLKKSAAQKLKLERSEADEEIIIMSNTLIWLCCGAVILFDLWWSLTWPHLLHSSEKQNHPINILIFIYVDTYFSFVSLVWSLIL